MPSGAATNKSSPATKPIKFVFMIFSLQFAKKHCAQPGEITSHSTELKNWASANTNLRTLCVVRTPVGSVLARRDWNGKSKFHCSFGELLFDRLCLCRRCEMIFGEKTKGYSV